MAIITKLRKNKVKHSFQVLLQKIWWARWGAPSFHKRPRWFCCKGSPGHPRKAAPPGWRRECGGRGWGMWETPAGSPSALLSWLLPTRHSSCRRWWWEGNLSRWWVGQVLCLDPRLCWALTPIWGLNGKPVCVPNPNQGCCRDPGRSQYCHQGRARGRLGYVKNSWVIGLSTGD